MKSKNVLSLSLAFVLTFSFIFFLPLNTVSASVAFPLPDKIWQNDRFISLHPDFNYENFCSDFFEFSGLDPEDYFLFLAEGTAILPSGVFIFPFSKSAVGEYTDGYHTHIYISSYPATIYKCNYSFSEFSSISQSSLFGNYPRSLCYIIADESYNFAVLKSNGQFYYVEPNTIGYSVISDTFQSFQPSYDDYQLTGWIVGSDISMEAFYQWIIDNNKLSELPSYVAASKLKSLISFYNNYGSSFSSFIKYFPQWLSYVSLPSQTKENANILKNKLDQLYDEFKSQFLVTVGRGDASQNFHHRNAINTRTDDSDTSLITDDVNDDVITSILRDILRGVIAIPNSLYNNTNAILAKLDSLSFNNTIVNNGGVPSGTDVTSLLNKMDDIIEALQADTVSVDIDQTTQDDTDQFFDDWNLEFKTSLDSKFPVAGQLSTLFTDFWEKCGVDVDNDGETFEYYNPGVVEARSEVRSLSSAGTSESDIVSDFLDQFDDSDPAFLDDASFNSVPDLSVSIGGSDVSIFDFRVYAKYRDKIHFIISLVIWSLYLLHLYKALPTIIGQVADVAVKVTDD